MRLKQLRESKFLTQRELSSMSGVALTTICRLERGQQEATFRTIKRLAAALEVGPEALALDMLSEERKQPGLVAGEDLLTRLQNEFTNATKGHSVVDELIAERREAALQEVN